MLNSFQRICFMCREFRVCLVSQEREDPEEILDLM